MLTRVDLCKHNAREAYYCVFGRYPDNPAGLLTDKNTITDYINQMLLSEDFQKNIIDIFLNAYSEEEKIVIRTYSEMCRQRSFQPFGNEISIDRSNARCDRLDVPPRVIRLPS